MGTISTPPQETSAASQRSAGLTSAQSCGAMVTQGGTMTHPTPHLVRLSRDGIAPEVSRPSPEKVIEGDPVHTTWNLDERGNLYAGLWHSTPGEWRIQYHEWEYVHILDGVSVLTDAQGVKTYLQAGDSFVIRPGFSGTWRVVEPTLKDYVILV
jgi:uncharacterized cupin superfamily protein